MPVSCASSKTLYLAINNLLDIVEVTTKQEYHIFVFENDFSERLSLNINPKNCCFVLTSTVSLSLSLPLFLSFKCHPYNQLFISPLNLSVTIQWIRLWCVYRIRAVPFVKYKNVIGVSFFTSLSECERIQNVRHSVRLPLIRLSLLIKFLFPSALYGIQNYITYVIIFGCKSAKDIHSKNPTKTFCIAQ